MKVKSLWVVLLSLCIVSCNSIFEEYVPEPDLLTHEDPTLYYVETEISVYKKSNLHYSSNNKTIHKTFEFEEHEVWEIYIILDTLKQTDRLFVEMFNASYEHKMTASVFIRKGGSKQKMLVDSESTSSYHL